MAKLIYTAISSLDGYVADAEGNFDWSAPDQEVHRFVNDLERAVGTHLYGRRMYEVMRYWESAPTGNGAPSAEQEYAKIWQTADKIVYSKPRARIQRPDIDSARVRRSGDPATQNGCGSRPLRERPHARCPGDQVRVGGKVSSVPVPRRGGRRQSSPARQCPARA